MILLEGSKNYDNDFESELKKLSLTGVQLEMPTRRRRRRRVVRVRLMLSLSLFPTLPTPTLVRRAGIIEVTIPILRSTITSCGKAGLSLRRREKDLEKRITRDFNRDREKLEKDSN